MVMGRRARKVSAYLTATLFLVYVILTTNDTKYSTVIDQVNTSSSSPPPQLGNDSWPGPAERPWYMRNGTVWPTCSPGPRAAALFPEEAAGEDRLIAQLQFVPAGTPSVREQDSADLPLKKVLFWTGASGWGVKPGRGVFLKEQCPVSTCVISTKRKDSASADLIIFKDHFIMPSFDRPRNQLWMIFMLESPLNTQQFKRPSVFNWTATYRSDSTVVTPYERWEYYQPEVRARPQNLNYAANKTHKVAWFVSNCAARNGRLEYARNLSKHIEVDIYGSCGTKQCPRTSDDCYKILNSKYKFYLAFENSNCVDYITEKFFVNGLKYNILPIVMGARKEDYVRSAPEKSFIHVDDFSGPEELAKYLRLLDTDDDLYNEYFRWKGTGEMINTKFFCRLCSLLHDTKPRPEEAKHVEDINKWWRGPGTCIKGSWKNYQKLKQNETITKDKS